MLYYFYKIVGEIAGQTKPLTEPTCYFLISKLKREIPGCECNSTFLELNEKSKNWQAFVKELFEGKKGRQPQRELH